MSSIESELSLGEAANHFLADLPPGERGSHQPEIYKFVRWFGWERPFAGLTAAEVANYAERLSLSDTDYMRKLELARRFLVQAKKKGWSKTNLSTHLRARKGKTRPQSLARQGSPETVWLTQQGYTDLEVELVSLRSKRLVLIDEIQRAAADKDFRENVPLQAAREQRGHLEGRIIELEETLKSAAIIDEKREIALKVTIGDSVILSDLDSGEELRYRLVSPNEVDPAKGKISSVSPIGRAVIGKEPGEIVQVAAPAGKRRYQIKQVER
ncbi:MAG: transcription elongation factor GreA [Chloroflexi bacterium]|nr:transcription elongation factor GreA [Chloroflexota bacterium]MBI3930843.1 transcription elongation factor GreA [Chloroflexota bacterium]